MVKNKNASSTVKATLGTNVWHLSQRDEEKGLDIELNEQGYEIVAL